MTKDPPDRKSVQVRSVQRNKIALAARLRTLSGVRDTALLTDISTRGCSLTCRGMLLAVEKRVIVQPIGLEGIPSIVRWVDGLRAGLEFISPLYEPVVEDLSRRNPADRTVTILTMGPNVGRNS